MNRVARLAPALALTFLAGCVSSPRSTPGPVNWAEHLAALGVLSGYTASGRLASRELDLRADFQLRQAPGDHFQLRLSGPFGAGALELEGTAETVEIRNRDGVQTTNDPEGWIAARYGWVLPIEPLRDWLLGIPHDGTPHRLVLDAQGRAASIVQAGWRLDYADYHSTEGHTLPRRIEASNGAVSLKILVDRWTMTAPLAASPP